MTCLIAIFTLLLCSGTEPTISLSDASKIQEKSPAVRSDSHVLQLLTGSFMYFFLYISGQFTPKYAELIGLEWTWALVIFNSFQALFFSFMDIIFYSIKVSFMWLTLLMSLSFSLINNILSRIEYL